MTIAVAPTQSSVLKVLRAFLLNVLPSKVEVILAQVNRVPEPKAKDFVLMTPIRRQRLGTNLDGDNDCLFVGSIAGNVLTVSSVLIGILALGATIFGTGIAASTTITSFTSGTGGPGTYKVSPSQALGSANLSCGSIDVVQETEIVVQLDVHGPSGADNAQIISTLLRDASAVDFMTALNAAVTPLYADDPRQMPFLNAEQQYEDRWVVEAHLQANETVTGTPQQYGDAVSVTVIDVDVAYPP